MTRIRGLLNVLGSAATEALSTVKKQVKTEVRSRLGVPEGMRTRTAIKHEAALAVRKDAADKLSALSATLSARRGSHPEQPGDTSRLDPGTAYQAMKAGLTREVVRQVATGYVPAKLDRLAARLAGARLTEANLRHLAPVAGPAEDDRVAAWVNSAGDEYGGWVKTDADTETVSADQSKARSHPAGNPLASASLKGPYSDPDLPHDLSAGQTTSTNADAGSPGRSPSRRSNVTTRSAKTSPDDLETQSSASGASELSSTASSVLSAGKTVSTTPTQPDSPLVSELAELRRQQLVKARVAQFGDVAEEEQQEAGPGRL